MSGSVLGHGFAVIGEAMTSPQPLTKVLENTEERLKKDELNAKLLKTLSFRRLTVIYQSGSSKY